MIDRTLDKINKFVPEKWQWILNHEGFRRYFKNTGWMFFGQMFSLLVSFFIGAWLARYLGPENYGVLSYAVAFVGIFSFISSLGIDSVLNRDLVKFPDKRDELLGTAFRLKLVGGIAAFLIAIFVSAFFQVSPVIKLLIVLLSFSFILQSINVVSIYFQAEVKSKNNVRALLFATIISSFLKIAVILLDKGVIWIVVVYVLDSLWQGIGFINAYKHFGLKFKNWKFKKQLAIELLNNSWPLMLASAAGFVYVKIDQVLIGMLMNTYEVGIYAAAVKLVEVWYFIPGIICASLFPAIINAKKTNKMMYERRLRSLYILMVSISLLMAIIVTFLAKPIIYVLFGNSYLESIGVLRIYIWSSVGLFLGTAIGQYLISENMVKTIFLINFLAMIVNIVLNLWFIPFMGLFGAAWATLVAYLVVPIIGLFIINYNKNKI